MKRDGVRVVTGASRGLGALIAADLARDANVVVLAARDRAGLERTAARVEAAGARAVVVPCDLSEPSGRSELVERAEAAGPVDLLVNNAGVEIAVAVLDQTDAEIEQQVRVNLLTPIHLTRSFLPPMIGRRRGAVVMVSSMSGKSPTPYNAIYTATKYGLNGFTAALRIELEGSGVHAGVVCPSFVADQGMWSDTGVGAPAMMREVPPDAVVRAVRTVMDGSVEQLVTRGPIRPMLAIAQLFPSLDGWALRALGVLGALRERADVVRAKRKG